MRLVFAGTPQTAVPSLDALLASRHEVAAVVTRPDAPAGRGRKLGPSPVARRAAAAGLELLTPARARDPEFLARLRQIAPGACPMVAYGALIPQAALDIPRHGWVNLHFSLLPAWRGAAPVQHAILHGDDVTGATTFRVVAELDAGPVYGVVTEPIRPADTAGSLLERLSVTGAGLLVATLDGIEAGTLEAPAARRGGKLRAQDHPRRRAGGLEAARARGRPADPRVHAAAGGVDRARRRPAEPRPGHGDRRRPPGGAAARRDPGPAARRVRRDRHAPGPPRRRAGPGQAAHAGRRLGPRPAVRRPGAVRLMAGRADPARSGRADPARRAAYDVLRAVTDRDAYANLLLPALLARRGLGGRDAAFATELAYGTLRGRGTYDAILAACSDRDDLDPPVRDVLRLGAHQLLATRVGSHAAVATSVDLARDVCGARPAGFVNAVLRKVA